MPVLSYLANAIRFDQREVPYSVVTAINEVDFEQMTKRLGQAGSRRSAEAERRELPAIVLSEWTATDLGARPGDPITLEYHLWEDSGKLRTETAQFRVDAIVPLNDEAVDRDLVPNYPGLTETENISDWDPPFPVDLKKVRPKDEDYW
jgi:hypothetical protein